MAASYNLVNALIQYTDIKLTIFTFSSGITSWETSFSADKRIKILRFPRNWRFRGLINYAGHRRLFKRVLKQERPDIIHAQGEGLYASLAVNSGIPNVYTIHGIRLKELEMERTQIGTLRYVLRSSLIRAHHRKASNIVAINEYTKKQIATLHNARVWIIRNAVDKTFFDLYLNEDVQIGNVLLVGGLRRRKDIITALMAVKNVLGRGIKITLHIVGPSEPNYSAQVMTFIEENRLKDNVVIHGLVSEEKIHELYRKADVFLLTSLEESSPISIVQAMAAGKPIVSTDVGGISEIIDEGSNGYLCQPRDSESIAESIMNLISDRQLRQRFATHSHRTAIDVWSARAVALATHGMYKEILNGK